MRIDLVVHIAQQAVRQWELHHDSRVAAEEAWIMLFSLRARTERLPEPLRQQLLDLWDAYGGLPPRRITKEMLDEFLDGLCEADFRRIERMTRAFAASAKLFAQSLST